MPGLPEITTDDDFINTNITGTPRDDDVTLIGGTLQYTADYGTLSLASSYYEHEVDATFDSTPILSFFGVPTAGVTSQPQTFETTMIEARFASNYDSPFNFVAGVYYQEDENEFGSLVTTTDGQGNAVHWDALNSNDFFGSGTAFFGRFREDTVEQQAVFGEATYEFTDNLHLLVGLRWFDADIESIQATTHAFGGASSEVASKIIGQTLNGNDIGLLKQSDDPIVPKFSLSYEVSDDVMIYGLYSEGFRVAGMPLNLIADATYRDESKTELRDSSPFNFTLDSYALVNVFFNLEVTDSVTVGCMRRMLPMNWQFRMGSQLSRIPRRL